MNLRQQLKTIRKHNLRKYYPYFILGVLLLLMLLLFKNLFIISMLVIASIIVSIIAGIPTVRYIGIEIILLATIITGVYSGPTMGGLVGFILTSVHMITTNAIGIYILWTIPAYVVVGVVSGWLPQGAIIPAGIISAILLQVMGLASRLIINPPSIAKLLPWSASNIAFNYIVFTYIAPWILLALQ